MAVVDQDGITPRDLTYYVGVIQNAYKAVYGEDLNFDPDTPQAQLAGALALLMTELDENVVDLANSLDIYRASGQQLDDLCSILSIPRKDAIKSNVNAQLTGVPLANVPAGSQAKLTTGELFELDTAVVLDGSGNGVGFFQAVEGGAIDVPANSLTQIVTQSPGWETIDNADAGATGVPEELDFQYIRRYFATLAVNAVAPLDAVISGVFDLEGVTDVAGFENDTGSPVVVEGVTLPAHSIAISVIGGADGEVAAEVRGRKTLGCQTVGDTTVSVPVYSPVTGNILQEIDTNFYRVSDVPNLIEIELELGPDFPDDGDAKIKQDLLAYYNGSDQFTGEFELDGLQISEDVYRSRLYTPVNRTPGHVITKLEVLRKSYPVFSLATTYATGDIVEDDLDGNIYRSLQDSNTGNQPSTPSPVWWEQITTVEVLNINLNEKASLTEDDITITTV